MPGTSQSQPNASLTVKVAASLALTALLATGLVAGVSDDAYAAACGDGTKPSGDGSDGDPWQIASKDNLLWVSWVTSADRSGDGDEPSQTDALAANYLQTANEIDLSDCEWTPIGALGNEFEGEYDGNDKTITDLNIDQPGTDLQGMFAATSGATIKDLNLVDVDIKGKSDVGGLIGLAGTGTSVSNVDVSGVVSSPNSGDRDSDIGGLVGHNSGTVTNSSAAVAISVVPNIASNIQHAGGFVGYNGPAGQVTLSHATGTVAVEMVSEVGGFVGENVGTIEDSHATGTVNGARGDGMNTEVGGFAGLNDSTDGGPGKIIDSYATGRVSGNDEVGGFVGENEGEIVNSYATGEVNARRTEAGGFVGYNDGGSITDSYATGRVSGNDEVGGFVGENEGKIEDSYATGQVNALLLDDPDENNGGFEAGGFAGFNDDDGTISNSYATGPVETVNDWAGGFVGKNKGTIRNASASGSASAGGENAGGFVGVNRGGTISDSSASGNATAATNRSGGFVGRNRSGGTIRDSSATGNATADERSGGFVGSNQAAVATSYATGDATSSTDKAGGFVGDNGLSGDISDSYATGSAEATVEEAGGFAGDSSGKISRSYSRGTATAPSGVGGFLGKDDGTTEDSFWDITTSGLTNSDGGDGDETNQATGKTTSEMTAIVTYNDTDTVGLDTAWAIVTASAFGVPDGTSTEIWGIGSGVNCGYPFLHWQDQSGHVCVLPDSGSGNSGRNDDDDDGDTVAAVVTSAPSAAATARPRVADATTRQPVAGPVLRGGVVSAPPRVPTVLVGGVPTIVEESSPDPTTLSVLAGSLSVDVSVDEGSGEVSRLDDGSNRLSVKSGSAAALRGSGLQPGARVQVFIPLGVDDSRELANVTVAADGTFSGELPVSTDPLAEPLPIGERLLQLVSVDADGNQVVFEMAVNVTQADPAPALDREAGEIPVVGLGASAVTSAGVVTAATMTALADQGLAIVEGDTWNMTIAIDSEQGGVESTESGALVTLVRNEAAQVSGVGFMAGTRADVWLFSEPVLLGTVTVDENGDFSGEVGIDSELIPTGEHTLQLQGVGQDGYVKAATMGVSVNDAQPELAAAEQAGLDLGFIWWILAIIVLVAIVVALWLRRNRRA